MPGRRYFSPEEMREIARKLAERANADRAARLSPASAMVCARALMALSANPTRAEIMALICDRRCTEPNKCMGCLGKANVVMRLYDDVEWLP
jgi:hypothetical protein